MVKKIIPEQIKDSIKLKLRKWLDKDLPNIYYCNVCNQFHSGFLPLNIQRYVDYDFIYSITNFETLNVWQYTCPICSSSDRDRLYYEYWKNELNTIDDNMSLIDFAPTKALQSLFRRYKKLNYKTADLYLEGVDYQLDIQNMSMIETESFDFLHCSHVLEHVIDEKKAIKELYRILKKGGKGIVMVPVFLGQKKHIEDLDITTDKDRWKYFGQDDHVRVHTKDEFIDLLKSVNFKIKEIRGDSLFPQKPYLKGIADSSILYEVTK